jgi:small-conductance mechanosensitive channel
VVIRVPRDADLDAARTAAISVGTEAVGGNAAVDCFLTKIEAASAILELRVQPAEPASRESLRAKMLARLAQRFGELGLDAKGADRASFS